MDKKEEYKLEVLIKECDSIGQGIRNLMLYGEKVMGLGFVVITTGLALGLREKINEILLLLPIVVLGVMLYGVSLGTELASMGGYKRYLEERINAKLGEHILLWELFIAKERHRDISNYFAGLVYIVILASTVYISIITASQHYEKWILYGIVIVILVLLIGLIICIVNIQKAFNRIYQMAKESAGREVIIDTLSNEVQKD